jgi:predicted aldo/keto reductase-like oxidoreductase
MSKIGEEVSRLGMGLMRLPTGEAGIDFEAAQAMIDRLIESGVTYFDTAYFYHNRESETFANKALLSRHKRDSFTIATKMPLNIVRDTGVTAQAFFDAQAKKLGADVIDFYLLHGLRGASIAESEQLGAFDVLRKMKKDGRLRYYGFSYHGTTEDFPKVLDSFDWDFCQIQLNYYDWAAGDAKPLYEAALARNVPIVVMEPVRGGGLANCNAEVTRVFKDANPGASVASWALRWCGTLPGVDVVLSGMSDMAQTEENINLFSPLKPLTDEEQSVIDKAMDAFRKLDLIPCTECNYCDKCPQGIAIPRLFKGRNDVVRFGSSFYLQEYKKTEPPEKQVSACVECGACEAICPQSIDIIKRIKGIYAAL